MEQTRKTTFEDVTGSTSVVQILHLTGVGFTDNLHSVWRLAETYHRVLYNESSRGRYHIIGHFLHNFKATDSSLPYSLNED